MHTWISCEHPLQSRWNLWHSDPLWKKHCMSNKKIISCFLYPLKTTVFTVSRKSFHTGCSNLTSMFLYVVIFQQMTCFFAVKTSPNMIGLTKKYHNQETTEKKFQSSWCSILYYFLNADWLIYWCAPLKGVCNKILNIKPNIGHISGTWELLLCEYWRKSMIINNNFIVK